MDFARTGAELWKQTSIPGAVVDRVTLDASGDLLMAGSTTHTGADFTVAKLAGRNGQELWRREIDGISRYFPSSSDSASGLTLDSAGNPIAIGVMAAISAGLAGRSVG